MGNILSYFGFSRQNDLTFYANKLQSIDEQLVKLQEAKLRTRTQQASVSRWLLLGSFFIWMCLATYIWLENVYLSVRRKTVVERLLQLSILIIFPLSVYAARRFIYAIFDRSLRYQQQKIDKLTLKKKSTLNEFMDRTNFRGNAQLIDKYSKLEETSSNVNASQQGRPTPTTTGPSLVRQNVQIFEQQAQQRPTPSGNQPKVNGNQPLQQHQHPTSTPPSAQPIVPGQPYMTTRDVRKFDNADITQPIRRGAMEKVVDFVLGDGPNARYALICKRCYTHNGLVREEDANIRFRCVYCNYINGSPLPKDWTPSIADPIPPVDIKNSTLGSVNSSPFQSPTLAPTISLIDPTIEDSANTANTSALENTKNTVSESSSTDGVVGGEIGSSDELSDRDDGKSAAHNLGLRRRA